MSFMVTCPACNLRSQAHKVVVGRRISSDDAYLRRFACSNCKHRWYTLQADPVNISQYSVRWSDRTRPPVYTPIEKLQNVNRSDGSATGSASV